ncbi:MAG: hypothetical protein GC208_10415 [Alphaproteobacteria bacterium]|nr:hypothetical protein [Alphaproteobacteria bacterium]
MARTDRQITAELEEAKVALRRLQSVPALIEVGGRAVDITPAADFIRRRIEALEVELNGPRRGGIRQGPDLEGP